MRILAKAPIQQVPTPDVGIDAKKVATSGLVAAAVMGVLTAASAVVSSIRSRTEQG